MGFTIIIAAVAVRLCMHMFTSMTTMLGVKAMLYTYHVPLADIG